jgi:hypothetical protein
MEDTITVEGMEATGDDLCSVLMSFFYGVQKCSEFLDLLNIMNASYAVHRHMFTHYHADEAAPFHAPSD